jgi:hypothetical protein
MIWDSDNHNLPRYQYAGTNQHGDRYKRVESKKIRVTRMSCKTSDPSGLMQLVLIGHHLDVPVHYDFDDSTAYIDIMSADAVRRR